MSASAHSDGSAVTERVSRFLVKILRHTPEEYDLKLNGRGWASMKDVREILASEFDGDARRLLSNVVEEDDQNRFQVITQGTLGFIRATRGHTTEQVDLLPLSPETVKTYLVERPGKQDLYVKAQSSEAVKRVVSERLDRSNPTDWENTTVKEIGGEDAVYWTGGPGGDSISGKREPHRIVDQRGDEWLMVEKRANMAAGDKGRYMTRQPERVKERLPPSEK